MSITKRIYTERVFLRVGLGKSEDVIGLEMQAIESTFQDALRALAEMVLYGPDRPLLEKEYTVVLNGSGSIADLSPHTDMLVESIPITNYVTRADVEDAFIFTEPEAFSRINPDTVYPYCALVGRSLLVRAPSYVIFTGGSSVKVKAVYVPLEADIASLPFPLEGKLIDAGEKIVRGMQAAGNYPAQVAQ